MTDTIRQHELDGENCKHCGAVRPGIEVTCISREIGKAPGMMPEPSRRVYAADDDSIAARIAELRAQRDALNQTTIEEEITG